MLSTSLFFWVFKYAFLRHRVSVSLKWRKNISKTFPINQNTVSIFRFKIKHQEFIKWTQEAPSHTWNISLTFLWYISWKSCTLILRKRIWKLKGNYYLSYLAKCRTLDKLIYVPYASAEDTGEMGLIPVLGISPGEGNGNPRQYSYLEYSMDRRACWVADHGTQSRTQLSEGAGIHTFILFK